MAPVEGKSMPQEPDGCFPLLAIKAGEVTAQLPGEPNERLVYKCSRQAGSAVATKP